ncbi:phosphoglucosamine mutase [Candidatus Fermentibacteria bacterium]|nr:MAG: phosphoglucosamine mutase [Candidatus Fermentibacteria bacterium]
MKPIISGSGIRGIFGASLNITDVVNFASAFGVLVGSGPVVVGRDTRRSGPAVEAAVTAGLMSVGCDPVLLGIVPTPTVQLEAMGEGVRGGIAITSSHNPGEWNALKLIGADGIFLRSPDRKRLITLLGSDMKQADYRTVGIPGELKGSVERHIEGLLSIPWLRREGRPLKAVLDLTGGAAAAFAPMLMERLGVDYTVINAEMTSAGDFPRVAEPTVESLSELSGAVINERADVGFAFDPDGDRLAMVDENGRIIGEDYTVALAIDFILSVRPGPAVVNLSTSRLAEDAAAKHGCRLFRSPVGEVNVVEEMEKVGAFTGGEGNGGVIDRDFHAGRDSGVAMACAISLLRENPDSSIGEWADSYPSYTMFKKKFPLDTGFDALRAELLAQYGPADDTRDGLWYRREGGWMHIRPSGTEPVVRFIAENRDNSYIEKDFGIFREAMESICVE